MIIMNNLDKKIIEITQEFTQKVALANTQEDLELIRIEYLSRSGIIANFMATLKEPSLEEKKIYGPRFNNIKKIN